VILTFFFPYFSLFSEIQTHQLFQNSNQCNMVIKCQIVFVYKVMQSLNNNEGSGNQWVLVNSKRLSDEPEPEP
jgi:hypothetical protein